MSRAKLLGALALAALLGGCEAKDPVASGDGPSAYEGLCGPAPEQCAGHCATSLSGFIDYTRCCDSYFCNCDPQTREWWSGYCDGPPGGGDPDAAPDATPDPRLTDAAPPDAAADGGRDAAP